MREFRKGPDGAWQRRDGLGPWETLRIEQTSKPVIVAVRRNGDRVTTERTTNRWVWS